MIEGRALELRFHGEPALAGIDLALPPRGLTVILGHSGSGKSSLLYVLSGLQRPSAGEVLLDGKPLASYRASLIRAQRFAFIFQDHFLVMHLNAFENVLAGAVHARQEERLRAAHLLARLGVLPVAEKRAWRLSGGQRQRVAVVRALVRPSSYLFADEPTAALDRVAAKAVFQLLREVADERAVLMVTHDPEALAVADRVITMRDGKVVRDERPALTTAPR